MSELITKSFTFEGKRYYVRAKTEREAIIKMANKQRDLEEGKRAVSGNMTVSEWAYKAVEAYKTNVKDITLKKYVDRMRKCILDEIGNVPLKRVAPIDCQRVLNIQVGKSKTQINEVYQTLKFIFRTARANKLIIEDPTLDLTKPKGYKTKRRAITDYEREHLLKLFKEEPRFVFFEIMLSCGCRPSEVRSLQGKDVGLMEGRPILHIRGTKTENADRIVPLPVQLYDKLKDIAKEDYICTNTAKKKYDETSYKRLCHKLYRELNISMGCKVYRNELIPPLQLAEDFAPYCLRHTFCTDLQKKGVDIRVAQYLMGHADIKMTANIYTHVDKESIFALSDILNEKV